MTDIGKALVQAADDELLSEIRQLGHEFVEQTRYILRTGTPQTKANLIRGVIPQLIRGALADDDGAGEKAMAALKGRLDDLHEQVRAGIGAGVLEPTSWDGPPEDAPVG